MDSLREGVALLQTSHGLTEDTHILIMDATLHQDSETELVASHTVGLSVDL